MNPGTWNPRSYCRYGPALAPTLRSFFSLRSLHSRRVRNEPREWWGYKVLFCHTPAPLHSLNHYPPEAGAPTGRYAICTVHMSLLLLDRVAAFGLLSPTGWRRVLRVRNEGWTSKTDDIPSPVPHLSFPLTTFHFVRDGNEWGTMWRVNDVPRRSEVGWDNYYLTVVSFYLPVLLLVPKDAEIW